MTRFASAHRVSTTPAAPLCEEVGRGAQMVVLPTADAAGEGPVVAIQLWIAAGTAAEGPQEHGCAHLLEHMLFKARAGETDLATAIEGLGGDVNAFTSHDETVVYATVPTGREHEALRAVLQASLCPAIEAKTLATEIEVVAEEIAEYRDDPAAVGSARLHARLFGRHPYARPVLGTAAEVRAHDVKRLRRFHRRNYTARRTSLVVVGPVDPAAVRETAEPWLSALGRGRALREGTAIDRPLRGPKVIVGTAEVAEAHLYLGWRGPALPDREAVALEVASLVLGYGEASRLTRGVRRERRLVREVHASVYPARQATALVVSAHASPGTVEAAVAAIVEQVEHLATVPLQPQELSRARVVLASDLVYRRETASGHAHALGQNLSTGGTVDLDERYHRVLAELTAADVRRACARWLLPAAASVSVVLPKGGRPTAKQLDTKLRALLQRGTAGRAKRKPKTDRHGVVATRLPGGLRLLAKIDRRVPLCAGWMVWPGGLRREGPSTRGASSMMATLTTRGCDAIGAQALAAEIEGQAAALDGFSGRNTAGLHFECMASSTPQVLRRAVQCVTAPSFAPDELEEARRVVLHDLAARDDDPAKLAFRVAREKLYGRHPFRWDSRGSEASVAKLTPRRLRRLWPRWYPLDAAVLAVCGDVDVDGLLGTLEHTLGSRAAGAVASPMPGAPPKYPSAPVEVALCRDQQQVHLAMAMPGPPLGHADSAAVDVLLAVLGGQAGRLFMALREQQGLVYTVAAQSLEGSDAGEITVFASASTDKIGRARQALCEQLDRIATEPVGPAELLRAKALLLGQHAMGMERHGRVAFALAFNEAFGLPRHDYLRYGARVQRVTAARLRTVARRWLDPRRRVVVTVGPPR